MRKTALVLACALLGVLPLAHAKGAPAPAPVVISEIYGGGGNSEALYSNDYVEIFNRTSQAIDVTNWTVGYSSATGTSWSSLTLRGTIPGYHYMLIKFGTAGGGGAALPVTPDATGSTNIARTAGKIRLTSPSGVVDLVGYGSNANAYEGHPTAAPPNNTQSITRQPSACSDTNDNAVDMKIKTPTPKNRASNGLACSTSTGSAPVLSPIGNKSASTDQTLSFTVSATDADRDPLSYSASSLPSGATFTSSTRTFSWRPTSSQIGVHPGVTFTVSDGTRKDSESITITVKESASGGTSSITVVVHLTNRRMEVSGTVSPNNFGHNVTVRQYRWQHSTWERIATSKKVLDEASSYYAVFARPAPGQCRVKATFYGGGLDDGSTKSVDTPC